MGEFKAQILGVILVLGVFAALNGVFASSFVGAWQQVSSHVVVMETSSASSLSFIYYYFIFGIINPR